jgi:hypothetical protein
MANFEQVFGRFVQSIGGEIVPQCLLEVQNRGRTRHRE